jgi:hypothetical protein
MPAIHMLRVDAIQLAHAGGKVALRCLDQKMIVIPHLAPRLNLPVESLARFPQDLKPGKPVAIFKVDILSSITPRSDVIKRPRELQTQRTRHPASRPQARSLVDQR